VSAPPRGFLNGVVQLTPASVKARKPRSCNGSLPSGNGYGVPSAMRLSCALPSYVSLRNRIVRSALISRIFFTVWHFFLPL
jgi:hypothetical protein